MKFADLAAKLGATPVTTQVAGEAVPDSFTVRLDGLPPVVVAAQYSSGSLWEVTFRVDVPDLAATPTIELTAEDDADRRGKQLGLNHEVQVGDDAFDDAVYIRTEASDELVRQLLAPPEVRARILQFIQDGRSVSIEGGVRVRVGVGRLVEVTLDHVRALAELAAHLPDVGPFADAREVTREPFLNTPICIGLAVLLYGLMFVVAPPEPIFFTHDVLAFAVGFVPWFAFAAAVVLDYRGRPDSYRQIVSRLVISVPVSILPATALGAWINSAWDPSPARVEVVQARYVELRESKSAQTREHVITVRDLAGEKEVTLEIDADELAIADPKDLRALRLTMRDGYFGWPYFTKVELAQ